MTGAGRPATAVIGAGRLAHTLVPLMVSTGYPLLAVASRTIGSARKLCRMAPSARATTVPASILPGAELVLIATPDRTIAPMAAALAAAAGNAVAGITFLHHAGALGPDALLPLSRLGAVTGVLHPLQALSGGSARSLKGSRARIEGDPPAVKIATVLARDTGLVPLKFGRDLRPSDRVGYHAAASLVSNDLLALLALGIDRMEAAGVDRGDALEGLLALARGSLANIETAGDLGNALTGPVVRGDAEVLAGQISNLAGKSKDAAEVHRLLSLRLLKLASGKTGPGRQAIARLRRSLADAAGRSPGSGV